MLFKKFKSWVNTRKQGKPFRNQTVGPGKQPQCCMTSTGRWFAHGARLPSALARLLPRYADIVHVCISTNRISPEKNKHDFVAQIPVLRTGKTKYWGTKGKFFTCVAYWKIWIKHFHMKPNEVIRYLPKSSYKLEILLWGLWVEIQTIINVNKAFLLSKLVIDQNIILKNPGLPVKQTKWCQVSVILCIKPKTHTVWWRFYIPNSCLCNNLHFSPILYMLKGLHFKL